MKRKFWFSLVILLSTGINSSFYSNLHSQEKFKEIIGIDYLTKGDYRKKPSETIENTTEEPSKDLTKKIIDTYSKVKETLKKADWESFGKSFEALDRLMDRLKKEQ